MNVLIYDSETNKLPLWGSSNANPEQPHIVQLAAALYDSETRKPVSSLNLITQPNGWEISQATIDIHGITNETALLIGVPEEIVLAAFFALWRRADLRVAHKEDFDARIIDIALCRFADEDHREEWKTGNAFCTLNASRPFVDARDKRGYKKAPNLGEAYEHFTGQPLANAHTAHGDTRGCAVIYFALKDAMNNAQVEIEVPI